MHSMMKNISMTLLGLLLFTQFSLAIEIKDLSHAVDVAGKQRMFTQRMLKDYGLIGQGCQYSDPRSDLGKTVHAFSNHLQALDDFNKEKETAKSLKKVMALWGKI